MRSFRQQLQCHKRSFRSRISLLQKGRCLLASKFSSLMIAAGTINALKIVWPSALHILCQWHTLNAVCRFCNNGNNGIKKPVVDQYCYDRSKGWFMVYAETRGKYEEFYQDLLSDATAKNIRNSFVIWRGNILQDQKSSQSISEWKIICPYMESIRAISLRL